MEDPIDAIKAGADDTAGTADDYTNLIASTRARTPTRTSSTARPATSTTRSPTRRSPARSPAQPTGTSTPTSPTSSTTTRPSSRRRRRRCTSRTSTARRTTTPRRRARPHGGAVRRVLPAHRRPAHAQHGQRRSDSPGPVQPVRGPGARRHRGRIPTLGGDRVRLPRARHGRGSDVDAGEEHAVVRRDDGHVYLSVEDGQELGGNLPPARREARRRHLPPRELPVHVGAARGQGPRSAAPARGRRAAEMQNHS